MPLEKSGIAKQTSLKPKLNGSSLFVFHCPCECFRAETSPKVTLTNNAPKGMKMVSIFCHSYPMLNDLGLTIPSLLLPILAEVNFTDSSYIICNGIKKNPGNFKLNQYKE